MQLERTYVVLLVLLVMICALLFFRQSPAEQRKVQVERETWYAEYGVPLPDNKTAEECFANPQSCL